MKYRLRTSFVLCLAMVSAVLALPGHASAAVRTCARMPVTVDLALGQVPTSGNDVIIGTTGNDVIFGGGGNDLICALSGNDVVHGGAGNDRIYLGWGNDVGIGNDGADYINGQQDDDAIYGRNGNDRLIGGSGDDELFGERGNDELRGDGGNDVLDGGSGNDRLIGYSGNDTLNGGPGSDRLFGNSGNDELFGRDGDDILSGGGGNDDLWGERGNDELVGGSGNDFLSGGAGGDVAFGGPGNDDCSAEARAECEDPSASAGGPAATLPPYWVGDVLLDGVNSQSITIKFKMPRDQPELIHIEVRKNSRERDTSRVFGINDAVFATEPGSDYLFYEVSSFQGFALVPGTTYTFNVHASNAAGNSWVESLTVTFNPPD